MTIELTQFTPLFEDRDGVIWLTGSRVPLDTVVYEFNQGHTRADSGKLSLTLAPYNLRSHCLTNPHTDRHKCDSDHGDCKKYL